MSFLGITASGNYVAPLSWVRQTTSATANASGVIAGGGKALAVASGQVTYTSDKFVSSANNTSLSSLNPSQAGCAYVSSSFVYCTFYADQYVRIYNFTGNTVSRYAVAGAYALPTAVATDGTSFYVGAETSSIGAGTWRIKVSSSLTNWSAATTEFLAVPSGSPAQPTWMVSHGGDIYLAMTNSGTTNSNIIYKRNGAPSSTWPILQTLPAGYSVQKMVSNGTDLMAIVSGGSPTNYRVYKLTSGTLQQIYNAGTTPVGNITFRGTTWYLIYAGTSGSYYSSTNAGSTWVAETIPVTSGDTIGSACYSDVSTSTLYLSATFSGGRAMYTLG
jgi:hypothetical protein